MEVISISTEQTKEFAYKLAKDLKPGDVLLLEGNLGSGKTTFTRYLVEALGITHRVQSPTYVICRRYSSQDSGEQDNGKITTVNHLDLYRITDTHEILDLGIQEMIKESNSITIIEWPELVGGLVFGRVIKLNFEQDAENPEGRKIHVQNLY